MFALIISHRAAIALLANCIDFIDKDDARRFLLGLFKKVTHLRCPHAHKHLDEFRSCNRKERHLCLACHCLGQHCLACPRRPDEQDAFWHCCTNSRILIRIVQIIHDFRKIFLRFILSGNIFEMNTIRRRHIDLCLILAKAKHHRISSASPVHELLVHILPDGKENQQGKDPGFNEAHDWRFLLLDVL